jgi:autotransporter-associated beta strand protein
MKRTSFGKLAIAAAGAAAAALAGLGNAAQASTKYWDIDGATTAGAGGATPAGTWDTATANWTTDSTGASAGDVWVAGDDAVFAAGGDATGAYTVNITGTQSVKSITVEEGTISQGAVNVGTDGILDFGANNGAFTIASGATWNNSGGTIIGTNGITLTGPGTLKLGGSNTFNRASGALLTINGGGTAEFSADLGLGGAPTAVNAAAVTLADGSKLSYTGTSASWAANRGLTVAGTVTIDTAPQSTAISGLSMPATGAVITGPSTATIVKTGIGRYTLNQTSNAYQGKWKVTGGVLNIAGAGRLGQAPASPMADYLTLDGGGLRISITSPTSLDINRGITLGAGGGKLIQPGGGTNAFTVASRISGTLGGNLTLDWQDTASSTTTGGSTGGVILFSNTANSYDGNTIINANTTLKNSASDVLPDTTLVNTVGSSAIYDLNGFNETIKGLGGTAGTTAIGVQTLTLNPPSGTATYTSVLTASAGGKLVKNGAGTQILTGSSVGFAGEMVVNAGVLAAGGANSFGSAAGAQLTINGGKIADNSGTGRNLSANLSLNMNGDFTIDDSVVAAPGTLNFQGTNTIRNSNRTITVGGPAFLTFTSGVGEDVAGRSLTKTGTGTLTMLGANTYTGNTIVQDGILSMTGVANAYTGEFVLQGGKLQTNGTGVFGSGNNIVHLSGGALNITANRDVSLNPIANPLDVTTTGAITTTSTAATVNLNLSSASITGPVGTTLTFRNDGAAGTGLFAPRFSAAITYAGDINLAAGSIDPLRTTQLAFFNDTPSVQTFSGVISGSGGLRRSNGSFGTGGDTLLSGLNTYSGGTELNEGGIALGSNSALGTGAVSINGVVGNIPKLSASGGARTVGNAINFVNTGAVLVLNGSNALTLSGAVNLGAAARTLQVDNTAATELSGAISGATGAGLTKTGAGTLKLSGVNTYDGGTTVSAGTVVLGNADATGGGLIDVADGALGQAQAALPKAVTLTTLNTHTSGKFDLTDNSMVIKGMGEAQVRTLVAGAYNAGHWNGATGLDSSTAAANANGTTAIGYATAGFLGKSEFKGVSPLNTTDVLVKYTYYGDNDLSGFATLDDFTLFLIGLQNGQSTWVYGDYDYSGTVTLDDFSLFLKGYQQQGAPLSELEALINSAPVSDAERAGMLAAVDAIPEPTSLALLGAAGAGLLTRRRRRH